MDFPVFVLAVNQRSYLWIYWLKLSKREFHKNVNKLWAFSRMMSMRVQKIINRYKIFTDLLSFNFIQFYSIKKLILLQSYISCTKLYIKSK